MGCRVGALWLLAVAVLAFEAGASWQDGDDGVDRPNGDLPDMPIQLNASQPASVCAQLCQKEAQCVAWAYCKADCGGSTSSSQCYLKSTLTQQTYNSCRVSHSQ